MFLLLTMGKDTVCTGQVTVRGVEKLERNLKTVPDFKFMAIMHVIISVHTEYIRVT